MQMNAVCVIIDTHNNMHTSIPTDVKILENQNIMVFFFLLKSDLRAAKG